jgi:hypothetical protein
MANDSMHWRTKATKRAEYHLLALVALRNQRIPREPINPAQVAATLYLWERMDDDNAMARMKWPLDALVRHGLLADDKRPACTVEVPEQIVDRKRQRITLVVRGTVPAEGSP